MLPNISWVFLIFLCIYSALNQSFINLVATFKIKYRKVGLLSACAYIFWRKVLVNSLYLLGAYAIINTLCIRP